VQREVNRNQGDYSPYTAVVAGRIATEREQKRTKRKLDKYENRELRAYVIRRLQRDDSPEQIAGTLREQPPPKLAGKKICLESIYQFIYQGQGRFEHLWPHLRRSHKKRQQQRARKAQKTTIPSRISIHLRPAEINLKSTIGHWESDTLEGKRKGGGSVSVQYERKSQLVRLHRVANHSADETTDAIRQSVESLPQYLWQSITFDNGKETAGHVALRDDYSLMTFHCDPYASWQKGGVENVNGLIRQYIPKGTNLDLLTDDQIYAIQERLNNRPRKSLNFLTPNQFIAQQVGH
jgi:IS30 family transposase